MYFLCIVDFINPAPHNNVFWHHHRKVVMDTDNNNYSGGAWSEVWNPQQQRFEENGNHYTALIWLRGDDFGSDNNGNRFSSWTTQGWQYGAKFIVKFLADETYVFTIERNQDAYMMSISGKFFYSGQRTYSKVKQFSSYPVV